MLTEYQKEKWNEFAEKAELERAKQLKRAKRKRAWDDFNFIVFANVLTIISPILITVLLIEGLYELDMYAICLNATTLVLWAYALEKAIFGSVRGSRDHE